jgi:hypothetical protein
MNKEKTITPTMIPTMKKVAMGVSSNTATTTYTMVEVEVLAPLAHGVQVASLANMSYFSD